MKAVSYTLLADGPTDRTLVYVIDWAIRQHGHHVEQREFADLRGLPHPPKSLRERITRAIELYPCDLLFIHRDAESQPAKHRRDQIEKAVSARKQPYVPVIPIRMSEAWFLHDIDAIRRAAGNPKGTNPIPLPKLNQIESKGDPKKALIHALKVAHGHTGRRRRSFNVDEARYRVAELIDNFECLSALPAFRRFQSDLSEALEHL